MLKLATKTLAIRAELFADDVVFDPAQLANWDEEEVRRFFETGGERPVGKAADQDVVKCEDLTQASSDAATPKMTASENISTKELDRCLGLLGLTDTTSQAMCDHLQNNEHSAFLPLLKQNVLDTQSARQKLSSALGCGRECIVKGSVDRNEPTRVVSQQELRRGTVASEARRSALPSGGAERRRRLSALPPHQRLSRTELEERASLVRPGEWFGLPIPTSLEQLSSDAFGAAWLTRAFQRCGTLADNVRVSRITSVEELPLQGDEAQGGAAVKAIINVEYSGSEASVHSRLFCKMPWPISRNPHWRTLLSSAYGDGDGRELSVYVLAEDLMPVRIPKLYFGDISRFNTNYVLITECVPYGAWDFTMNTAILSKCNKYQDDRLANASEYYYALMRAFARVAAADKRGDFEAVIESFTSGTTNVRQLPDSETRRAQSERWVAAQMDALIDFATVVAPKLFPRHLCSVTFLTQLKAQCVECSRYFHALKAFIGQSPHINGLSHANLQIDNGFFWREDGVLQAGLLDWYNFSRAPFPTAFLSCLGGAEADVLSQHLDALMECFAMEYHLAGGPKLVGSDLARQFRLVYVPSLVGGCSFIESDIYREGPPREEWNSVLSKDDPRVMGRWNVRCRTVAIIQSLAFWQTQDLHPVFMQWVRENGLAQM